MVKPRCGRIDCERAAFMIAVLAGSGQLPALLYQALHQKNEPFVVVVCDTSCEPIPAHIPMLNHCSQWGKVGALLDFFHQHNVTHIIMAGAVSRPHSIGDLKFDWRGLQWMNALRHVWNRGDDGLLRGVMSLLEKEGFQTLSPQDFLGETPIFSTQAQPTSDQRASIDTGKRILQVLSTYDVGQSLIMAGQRVLGIEGPEGTDDLIQRCAPFLGEADGVLIKMAKTGQSLLVDQPTIGSQTILNLAQLGYKGLAFEPRTVQTIDAQSMRDCADKNNLFIFSF